MTLQCSRSKSCKCYWKLNVFEKKIHLKRFNTPTHNKELILRKRNKMTRKQASNIRFNVKLYLVL